jgi:choline kinase
MNFIILASGKGNRVKSLTKNFPKALIKITNKLRIIDLINFTIPEQSNKIAVLGYKFNFIKKKIRQLKYTIVQNKEFNNTNMVESMFCAKNKILKKEVIVIYSDIIFEKKLIKKLISVKGNVIPLNKNWYENWKKRMPKKEILHDAENVKIIKNKVVSIGGKITKKLPKFQYMGILKFKYKDFIKLNSYYKKLGNKKIDLTSFINCAIKNKIITMNYCSVGSYWTEIDTIKDYILCKKNIKNELSKNYIQSIEKKL